MASCPNCGFDLNDEGECSVCGYGTPSHNEIESVDFPGGPRRRDGESSPKAERGPDGGAGHYTGTAKGGAKSPVKRTPLIVGIAAVCLIAAVGVFVVLWQSSSGSGSAVAASQRTSAAQPERQTRQAKTADRASTAAGGSTATVKAEPAETGSTSSSKSSASASTASASKISRADFSAPVGASPTSIRATHPIDLYNPSKEPVYNITKRTQFPPLTSENAYVRWMLEHTDQQGKYLRERWARARKAVERHLVIHRSVLMGFLLTPREWFARSYNLSKVYDNTALPIGYGQTISGPDLVAHMTDALDPRPNQKILEIGTGSGYQSAFLSQLSNYVYTIEIVRPLAEQTNEIYLKHTKEIPEFANIHRRLADGYYGWPAYAPFDRIIVTTGIDHIPPDLLKELKPGGIMVIPIGPPSGQTILKITKTVDKNGNVHLTRKDIYHGIRDIFVPFTASGGGTHDRGSNSPSR